MSTDSTIELQTFGSNSDSDDSAADNLDCLRFRYSQVA